MPERIPTSGFSLEQLMVAHPLLHISHCFLVLVTVCLLNVIVEEEIDGEAFVLRMILCQW